MQAVLSPLLAESPEILTTEAGINYEKIRRSPELSEEQRDVWLEVFHFWLMMRLNLTMEDLRKMIVTKFPDVEELAWGKELKQRWTEQGREEGRLEGRLEQLRDSIRRSDDQLKLYDELFAAGKLAEEAYAELKEKLEANLRDYQAELERITSTNGQKNG